MTTTSVSTAIAVCQPRSAIEGAVEDRSGLSVVDFLLRIASGNESLGRLNTMGELR